MKVSAVNFASISKRSERIAGCAALLVAGGLMLDASHRVPEIFQPTTAPMTFFSHIKPSTVILPAEVVLNMLSSAVGATMLISSFGRVKKRRIIDF